MSDNQENLLSSGGYAKKQLFSKWWILRWSHQSRFNKGIELAKRFKPKSIADYGCGDATYLIFLKDEIKKKVGIEIDKTQLNLLHDRFKGIEDFSFFHTAEPPSEKYDMVTCFEVLEHCTDENINKVASEIKNLTVENGTVVISVPIEIGLTMAFKQLMRRILGLFKFGSYEYSETYSMKEFFQMLFATENTKVHRHFYEVELSGVKTMVTAHKGFNWKSLKPMLSQYFTIEDIQYTPGVLPFGILSSQVWFICKNKKSA